MSNRSHSPVLLSLIWIERTPMVAQADFGPRDSWRRCALVEIEKSVSRETL